MTTKRKRLKTSLIALILTLTTVLSSVITPVPVYANIPLFVAELVMQKNTQDQMRILVDEYVAKGFPFETAFTIIKDGLQNTFKDVPVLSSLIGYAWDNLNPWEQQTYIDLHDQIQREGGGGTFRGGGIGSDYLNRFNQDYHNSNDQNNTFTHGGVLTNAQFNAKIKSIESGLMGVSNTRNDLYIINDQPTYAVIIVIYHKGGSEGQGGPGNESKNMHILTSRDIGIYGGYESAEDGIRFTRRVHQFHYTFNYYNLMDGSWHVGRFETMGAVHPTTVGGNQGAVHKSHYTIVPNNQDNRTIDTTQIINNHYTNQEYITVHNEYYHFCENGMTDEWFEEVRRILEGQTPPEVNITINIFQDPGDNPDPTPTPTPNPTPTPGPGETPDPTQTPEPGETPNPTSNPGYGTTPRPATTPPPITPPSTADPSDTSLMAWLGNWFQSIYNAIKDVGSDIRDEGKKIVDEIKALPQRIADAINVTYNYGDIIMPETGSNSSGGFWSGLWDRIFSGSGSGTNFWDTVVAAMDLSGVLARVVSDTLKDIFSFASDLTTFGSRILDFIENSLERVTNLLASFIIPSEGFIESEVDRVKSNIEAKIPIVGQVMAITNEIRTVLESASGNQTQSFAFDDIYDGVTPINATNDASRPDFSFTLPDMYGGGTYQLIDLSFFDEYRNYIHGITGAIAVFFIVRRIVRKAKIFV